MPDPARLTDQQLADTLRGWDGHEAADAIERLLARLAAAEIVVEAMGQSLRLVYESRWFGIEGFPTNEVRDALAVYDAHKKPKP